MDWLIYHLLGDVLNHYFYAVACRIYSYVKNRKAEGIVASVVVCAWDIPGEYVSLYPKGLDIALVVSVNNYPHIWTVTYHDFDYAQCNY